MTRAPLITLNDGNSIPQVGLGTWPLDDDQAATAVVQALEAGYRHIDTAVKYGKVRSIGVSNFKRAHLERLMAETDVVPALNQIQLSPAITRTAERDFHKEHGIITESYSPLGGSGAGLLGAPILSQLGEKHGKTPGQLVLRWHVQNGIVTIPKTANPERMRENLDIFDFTLDPQDLAELAILDEGPDAGNDSDVTGH